jgi:hypothetical protein
MPRDDSLKQTIAQEVIDRIVDQAKAGENRKGRNFKNSTYSDSYADSLRFQAFGKSQNDVDLTLTGQMLDALDVRKVTKNTVEIGWTPASTQGKKAHGHITGQAGQNPQMKRDFFGLPKKQLNAIKKEFKGDVERVKEQGLKNRPSPAEEFLKAELAKKFSPTEES